MIIIIGLVILVAAMVAGVAGVLSNSGSGHALSGPADVQSARNQLICSWPLASPAGGRLCVSRWRVWLPPPMPARASRNQPCPHPADPVRSETSSTSCDQAIFVDHATHTSEFSYAVLVEVDRLRQRFQLRG